MHHLLPGPIFFALVVVQASFTTLTVGVVAFLNNPRVITRNSRHHRLANIFLGVNIKDIEGKAQTAAEEWDQYVTNFLTSEEASEVESSLGNRADVAVFRIGGSSNPARSRFLFTNPDLGMDGATAEGEYCTVLCVENANLMSLDPWPNILSSIGADLANVGDIFEVNGKTAYLVVAPEIAKVCSRLLPKELPGAGVTVSVLDPGEVIPDDGELQDMDMKRLDKRAQKRK